jgi:hypothetical protein
MIFFCVQGMADRYERSSPSGKVSTALKLVYFWLRGTLLRSVCTSHEKTSEQDSVLNHCTDGTIGGLH